MNEGEPTERQLPSIQELFTYLDTIKLPETESFSALRTAYVNALLSHDAELIKQAGNAYRDVLQDVAASTPFILNPSWYACQVALAYLEAGDKERAIEELDQAWGCIMYDPNDPRPGDKGEIAQLQTMIDKACKEIRHSE